MENQVISWLRQSRDVTVVVRTDADLVEMHFASAMSDKEIEAAIVAKIRGTSETANAVPVETPAPVNDQPEAKVASKRAENAKTDDEKKRVPTRVQKARGKK